MKLVFFIFLIFFLSNCSKPKTVLICGDHICVNKAEAEQYFEENLSIEVKIVNRKLDVGEDLVELNLKENSLGDKKISISSKEATNNPIKTLSDKEVNRIKENIKNKEKEKKIAKKTIKKENEFVNKEISKSKKTKFRNKKIIKSNVNKRRIDVVDVCTIIEKCSIDEISKYLLEDGRNKKFPDITTRQ
tara:strand:- start:177 stop:743 length:567 start_codon:yes stop_codon:yes gene_type:complete